MTEEQMRKLRKGKGSCLTNGNNNRKDLLMSGHFTETIRDSSRITVKNKRKRENLMRCKLKLLN